MTEADIEQELDLQQAALDAETVAEAAQPTERRGSLREAARSLLDAWDAGTPLDATLAGLRAALTRTPGLPRAPATPRQLRHGTKQEAVLALLRRPEGASVAQIAEATGWQAHTVRGFFAGLKKHGIEVSVLERVRQVGPNKTGAKGSYTVYRIGDAG